MIAKDVMKMEINEKGWVVMSKAAPSVYNQVMEKSSDLEQKIEAMTQLLASK